MAWFDSVKKPKHNSNYNFSWLKIQTCANRSWISRNSFLPKVPLDAYLTCLTGTEVYPEGLVTLGLPTGWLLCPIHLTYSLITLLKSPLMQDMKMTEKKGFGQAGAPIPPQHSRLLTDKVAPVRKFYLQRVNITDPNCYLFFAFTWLIWQGCQVGFSNLGQWKAPAALGLQHQGLNLPLVPVGTRAAISSIAEITPGSFGAAKLLRRGVTEELHGSSAACREVSVLILQRN